MTAAGRRLVQLIALIVLGTGLATAQARPAAAAQFEVYQWNMSGWKVQTALPGRQPEQGNGYQAVAKQAKYKILAHDPLIVTLNEICSSQYNYLVRELEGLGYVSFTYTARSGVDENKCTWFGNAVFAKGAFFGSLVSHRFAAHADHSTVEKKGLVCRRVYLLGGTYVPCTGHTWPSDDEAADQSREAYGVVNQYYAGSAPLFGGDLNLRYDQHRYGALSNWYSVYHEADDGGAPPTYNEETVYQGRKIDFLFANAGTYNRISGNVVTSDGWSDHDHLYGTFDT